MTTVDQRLTIRSRKSLFILLDRNINERIDIMKKHTFEFIKEQFKNRGFSIISVASDYKDTNSKLKYLCDSHGIQTMSYHNLQKGQGCPRCADDRLRLTYDFVKDQFEANGYELLETKYIDNRTKMKCLCKIHGEFSIRYNDLKSGYGCFKCGVDARSRDNNYMWRGGITELNRYLRGQLNTWVSQQLQRANYRCELTGKQGVLNVHHMFSFKKILDITINELVIDIRPTIGNYTEDELQLITVNLIKNNDILANPKVLLESVHQEFHAFCGGNQVDTTQELWDSFVCNTNTKSNHDTKAHRVISTYLQ